MNEKLKPQMSRIAIPAMECFSGIYKGKGGGAGEQYISVEIQTDSVSLGCTNIIGESTYIRLSHKTFMNLITESKNVLMDGGFLS